MSRVIGAAFYAMAARYISLLIQLVSVMAVSRLLTPEEIGIYSIAASIFGLALLIRDFGIGSYLIQEKIVDGELAASAFFMSLLLCWPLAAMSFISGPYIAAFYELEGMANVFSFLAINLIVIPFGSITLSLLKREMKFNKVMIIDIGSSLASASVTIFCALNNFSFMSLAYGSVAGTLATVCLAAVYRPKWLPVLPSVRRLKEIVSFGWRISGSNIFTQINTSSPDMILGKVQGAEVAVYFNKTVSIFKLFNQLFLNALRPVYLSYFAEERRLGGSLKNAIIIPNGIYLVFAWWFASFIQFHADGIVYLLFGSQWEEIVPLVRIMAIVHALNSVFIFHPTTLLGTGEVGRIFRYSAYICVLQTLIIIFYSSQPLIYIISTLISVSLFRYLIIKRDLFSMFDFCFSDLFRMCKLAFWVAISVLFVNLSLWTVFSINMEGYPKLFAGGIISFISLVVVVALSGDDISHAIKEVFISAYSRLKLLFARSARGDDA